MAGRVKAQLPTGTNNPNKYLDDDNWVITQKLDGQRLLVHIKDNKTTGINRNGEERNIPPHIDQALCRVKGEWIFDGELVGKTYWIFDVVKSPIKDIDKQSYVYRQELLAKIFASVTIENCKLLQYKSGKEDKQRFYQECVDAKVEGVVFKKKLNPYVQGRNENFIKHKFVTTVDCVITGRGINNKDNFVLSVYRSGELFECGKVSAVTGDGPLAQIGDVVEVTVLYATESGKLYQPVKPKIRTDKLPEDCTFDQIEMCATNKQVLEDV